MTEEDPDYLCDDCAEAFATEEMLEEHQLDFLHRELDFLHGEMSRLTKANELRHRIPFWWWIIFSRRLVWSTIRGGGLGYWHSFGGPAKLWGRRK